jgi:signal transduction histidine kinase
VGFLPINDYAIPAWRPGMVIFMLLIHIGIALESRVDQRNRATQKEAAEIAHAVAQQERNLRTSQTVFFSFVAHELRTPLGVLIAGLKNIGRSLGPAEEAIQLRINRLSRTADVMGRLIERHLTFQRLHNADFSPAFDRTSTQELAAEALTDIRQVHPSRHFRMSVEEGVPHTFTMDRSLVKMVLTNMLGNAAKYSLADTPIHLRVSYDGALKYSVVDRGPGMPKDSVDRLLTVYQRSPDTHEQPGFGIGLALCKRVAELHLGAILYAPGQRSCSEFTLTLPVQTP